MLPIIDRIDCEYVVYNGLPAQRNRHNHILFTNGNKLSWGGIPSPIGQPLTSIDDENLSLIFSSGSTSAILQPTTISVIWKGALSDSRIASSAIWNAKQNAIALGTPAQYLRGDLSLASFPTIPVFPPAGGNSSQYINGIGGLVSFPSIPAAQVNSDWNATTGITVILNKPTIPAAQVSSDWNAASGVTQILNKPTIPTACAYFNASGAIAAPTKKWVGLCTPNTGNGFTVSIASAGFTNILSVNVLGVNNTSAPTSCPLVTIKTITTTAITFNITQGNASLVTLLGSGVLLGIANVFANITGVTFYLEVTGN